MSRFLHVIGLACLFVAGSAQCISAQTEPGKEKRKKVAQQLDVILNAARKAQTAILSDNLPSKIDDLLTKRMTAAKVKPAPLADDAEFLRRIYLDLAGRIPSVAETRTFLADKQPDRRAKVVDRLLASPRYALHFSSYYRNLLIPEANNNFFVRLQQDGFESWLKKQLAANVGYDRMTRELLTVSVGNGNQFDFFGGQEGAGAFYAAKEYKPESLAAGAARVFLGVRVECAQCHKHPFAEWTKEQFWGLAAFFSGIKSRKQNDVVFAESENRYKREITIPSSEKVIKAQFLDGTQPNWDSGATTRAAFADWVISPTNPYFARAAVNRTWAYFLGTGLVEPIDEMIGSSSDGYHPELLDLLAREFTEHKYDLKFLIRTITLTQAYQRTSSAPAGDKSKLDATMFSRMPLRGLTPEQLFDSVAMATGFRDSSEMNPLGEVIGGKVPPRSQFLAKFANQTERATMAQTSILQALSLMNGKVVADATSLEHSETLAALIDAPFLSTAERIEALYLAALSRPASEKELRRNIRFIDDAVRDAGDRNLAYAQAVADVFWALLNSSEFVLNH
jgi:hypothetical protein